MKYNDLLLIEFLMFSDNIEKEINDFDNLTNEINIESINEVVDTINSENIYTEQNLNNFKILLKKLNIKNYNEVEKIINKATPSNDIYYYEYLEKFDVLENKINNLQNIIPKKLLENSIRFDFYSFYALISNKDDYVKFLPNLLNNQLFILFIKKILNEQPDILLNKTVYTRIIGILNVYLCNDDISDYIMKLKQKVNYFTKNKQATIFDYEKFKYHYNTSFFKYLITSNVDISIYHNYVISDEFVNYIEEEINKYELENYKNTFPYLEEQKNRIKYILNYALNYKQNNEYKLLYNSLIHKLNTIHSTNQFYNEEYVNRNKMIDIIRKKEYSKEEINYDLKNEYEILRIYGLNEQEFNLNVPKINKHTYIKWLRNMIYLDINFLNNDILRNRTLYILNQIITSDKILEREKQKIKNKILKINKELEY